MSRHSRQRNARQRLGKGEAHLARQELASIERKLRHIAETMRRLEAERRAWGRRVAMRRLSRDELTALYPERVDPDVAFEVDRVLPVGAVKP